jgi:hypothetical protein
MTPGLQENPVMPLRNIFLQIHLTTLFSPQQLQAAPLYSGYIYM